MAIFGTDFYVLQVVMALVSTAGIFFIAKYFSYRDYGVVGLVTPFLVLFSAIYIKNFYLLLSDSLFLTLTIAILICWRTYEKTNAP